MATFVFVAGGFHGGWCWQRVAKRLRGLGHEVHTPSLTGLADRSHLLGPDISVETHITDIANLLEWKDLSNVHLVGHSYAGAIVTAVADRNRDRVRQVVYFDPLWPEDGDTVEYLISGPEMAEGVLNNAASEESGPVLAAGVETAELMGLTDPEDIAWAAARLTAQPPGTMRDPIHLIGRPLEMDILVIECTDNAATDAGTRMSIDRAHAAVKENPRITIVPLHAPHDAMITHPVQSAEILHNGASRVT